MLQNIRDNAQGTAAKIIVGLIVLTFALFGIESIVSLGGGEDAPASVNGEDISEYEIAQMVELQKRRFQAQFGENFDPSFLDDNMLRRSATESLIEEKVLKQAAENTGVYFSDAAIDRIILQSPEFQVDGQFDRDRFDLILRNAGFTRFTYREMIRNNLIANQNRSAWQMSAFSTSSEATRNAELKAQKRDFAYLELKLDDVKKEISVTDDELNEFYDNNKDRYKSQEMVKVDYVQLSREKIAEEVSVEDEEIDTRYANIKAESASKKEYRPAHILLTSTDEEAKNKIKEIQSKLSSGESFESLVETYSDDDSSKMAGGDLGFASPDIFEPEFSEALLSLNEGEVSELVETRDGLHLIKLLEMRQPEVSSLDEMKDQIVADIKNEKAGALYVERLEVLKDESFSSDDLKGPSSSLDIKIQTTGFFTKQGGAGIAQNPQVSKIAFSEEVLFDNANSEVIELPDGSAVVLRLNEHKESKVKPFDEVRAQVESALIAERANKLLEEKANEMLAKAKSGEAIDGWQEFKGQTRNGQGVESAVLAEAFKLGATDSGASFSMVTVKGSNKAIVRLDQVVTEEVEEVKDEHKNAVVGIKSQSEFNAYKQLKTESSEIDRG